jgi:hypothetical protein
MQLWTKTEKRKAPRFEIDIPVTTTICRAVVPVMSKIHDISAYGVGTMLPFHAPIGTELDLMLMMPEKEDQVRFKGKIIWVQSMVSGNYRVGIQFLTDHFNPIPYVLKTLQHKAMARFPYGHAYPA